MAGRFGLVVGLVVLSAACSSSDDTKDPPPGDGDLPGDSDPVQTWAAFRRDGDRVFRGQLFDGAFLASDPCVIKDGATYRMFYTCVADATTGGLCGVTSTDGFTWTPVASIDPAIDGLVIKGRPGTGWDENMETCAVRKDGSTYTMFYSGYTNLDVGGNRFGAGLGQLTSADGIAWSRVGNAPVLTPTVGGRDGDDIFSAVTIGTEAALEVVYVGWCVDGYHDGAACDNGQAVQLLGATRTGGVWTKRDVPVLAPATTPSFMSEGVAEPEIVRAADGTYYLFFTGALASDEARVIGIARGPSAFGPWTVHDTPVVRGVAGAFDACGALAPSVVLEADTARMWYLGIDDCAGTCPSCDMETCGCEPRFSIGYAEATLPLYGP